MKFEPLSPDSNSHYTSRSSIKLSGKLYWKINLKEYWKLYTSLAVSLVLVSFQYSLTSLRLTTLQDTYTRPQNVKSSTFDLIETTEASTSLQPLEYSNFHIDARAKFNISSQSIDKAQQQDTTLNDKLTRSGYKIARKCSLFDHSFYLFQESHSPLHLFKSGKLFLLKNIQVYHCSLAHIWPQISEHEMNQIQQNVLLERDFLLKCALEV